MPKIGNDGELLQRTFDQNPIKPSKSIKNTNVAPVAQRNFNQVSAKTAPTTPKLALRNKKSNTIKIKNNQTVKKDVKGMILRLFLVAWFFICCYIDYVLLTDVMGYGVGSKLDLYILIFMLVAGGIGSVMGLIAGFEQNRGVIFRAIAALICGVSYSILFLLGALLIGLVIYIIAKIFGY